MTPEFSLILHNIVSVASAVIALGVGLFVFIHGKNKEANIAISLTFLSIAIFFVSHILGVNVSDHHISRNFFLANVCIMFIGTFNLHAVIALFRKTKGVNWIIFLIHGTAIILSTFFLVFPETFLHDSIPKMYFPNYYNPGDMNWLRIAFLFLIVAPYATYQLILSYKENEDTLEKKQIIYLGLAMLFGYGVGFIPNFLVYNIPIDPLWGTPTAIMIAIPFIYGAVQYRLFSVKIIAKEAFFFGVAIGVVGSAIALLNYISRWIESSAPGFPIWSIYLVSALLVVTTSVLVWRKIRENDFLKYEFITTMTHKLRTPMTGIRWCLENLAKFELDEKIEGQVELIRKENTKLIELTNLLTNISEAENNAYEYKIEKEDISKTTDEVLASLYMEASEKNIAIKKNYRSGIFALFDVIRIKFVLQVFLENAIHYTPKNGQIGVFIEEKKSYIEVVVKDSGIGISNIDLARLFTKFYRSHLAKITDTEGVGIGLFISKDIITRQKGKIWAESDGEGKGSSFHFTLPKAEEV